MANDKLKKSQAPGGAHHLLHRLVGEWQGNAKTWFEPGKLADESPIAGSIRSVLDGRFVIFEYEGGIMGKTMLGSFLFGYNLQRKKFEGNWIDSFHNGTNMMHCEGERSENGFWVSGNYDAPEGPPWGWRTEVDISEADRLVITMYNITPQGEEAKAVEMALARTTKRS